MEGKTLEAVKQALDDCCDFLSNDRDGLYKYTNGASFECFSTVKAAQEELAVYIDRLNSEKEIVFDKTLKLRICLGRGDKVHKFEGRIANYIKELERKARLYEIAMIKIGVVYNDRCV